MKELNGILESFYLLRRRTGDLVEKTYEENGTVFYETYYIKEHDIYIQLICELDSYEENEYVKGIKIVDKKEKNITVFE